MLQLLGLPTEILLQILEEVRPEDIEQMAMSCKFIYSLAEEKALGTHAKMKRKYRQIILCKPKSLPLRRDSYGKFGVSTFDLALLLRDVLVNDRIGFYPQDIVIGSLSHQSTWHAPFLINPAVEIKDFDARIFEGLHDILLRKLLECPYLEDCDAQLMRNKIAEGSKTATAAFLITLFPNLRSMRVHFAKLPGHRGEDPYHPYIQDMLVKIAKASSVSEPAIRSPALSKLSAVEIHSGLHFGDLLLCAALPSLRSIGGRKLSCDRLVGLPGADMSRLQTIKLSKSDINCAGLIKVLGRVKALKVFGYHNSSVDFQPGKILMQLTESAAHSLTHLTLTTSPNPEKRINMASFTADFYGAFGYCKRSTSTEIHSTDHLAAPGALGRENRHAKPIKSSDWWTCCPNRSKSAACRGAG